MSGISEFQEVLTEWVPACESACYFTLKPGCRNTYELLFGKEIRDFIPGVSEFAEELASTLECYMDKGVYETASDVFNKHALECADALGWQDMDKRRRKLAMFLLEETWKYGGELETWYACLD